MQLLQVEALNDSEFKEVVRDIEHYHRWIVGYLIITSLLGCALGYEVGCLIVGGPLRRLAEHAWVYDLKVEGKSERTPGVTLKVLAILRGLTEWIRRSAPDRLRSLAASLRRGTSGVQTITIAYALTDISHDQRHLIYRGFLKAFGISKDGKPLYLVLSGAERSYMLLHDPHPATHAGWRIIGSSSDGIPASPGPRLSSYLVVSGDHITNVVFDRHAFTQTPVGVRALDAADAALSGKPG